MPATVTRTSAATPIFARMNTSFALLGSELDWSVCQQAGDSPPEGSEDPMGQRVTHQVGAALQEQLLHEARAIGFDRLGAQRQLVGDLLAGVSLGDEREHLALAPAESFETGGRLTRQDQPRRLAGEREAL